MIPCLIRNSAKRLRTRSRSKARANYRVVTHLWLVVFLLRRAGYIERSRTREANELVRLALTNNRVLSAGHLHRFNNGVKELKRVVDSGVLGDTYYLRLRWTGLLPAQKERDVITDLGPHPFDICNDLLDLWPAKISCRSRGYRGQTS